jgi:predicted dehydrogenase
MHLSQAVKAGKHVFAEKPVAVDSPGVRSALASTEIARQKGLSLVAGLCWRYDNEKVATINQVLEGRIGEIRAMQCTYNTGALWHRGDKPEWSRMEWQLRNWLYFTWLSGDHIAEQHIHSLDKMPWAMGGEYPVRCVGNGGRQVRTDPMYGNVFDHFNTTYEWANGVKAFASSRQMEGCKNDVTDHIFGSKGTCHVFGHQCTGENPWVYEGDSNNMYQTEHDRLFASIRSGETINDGDYLAKTTLMSIMGRMAAYTGQEVTWDQALNSEERLGPTIYDWSDVSVEEIARPGITRMR